LSLDSVVVSSAADADQHAAAIHAIASAPLDTTAACHPVSPESTFTPAGQRSQLQIDNFAEPRGSVAASWYGSCVFVVFVVRMFVGFAQYFIVSLIIRAV
jgi:hypothetical protein